MNNRESKCDGNDKLGFFLHRMQRRVAIMSITYATYKDRVNVL